MREQIAIVVATLAVCFAVFMSALFASRHNAAPSRPQMTIPVEAPSLTDTQALHRAESLDTRSPGNLTGARVYEVQRCEACHSIKGVGNPRSPLDGVADRLTRKELRDAVTGSGVAANKLPKTVRQRKAHYAQLPEPEMAKLLDYLATLTAKPN